MVQSHLTDVKKIAAYNQRKEQKLRVGWEGSGDLGPAAWPEFLLSSLVCLTCPSSLRRLLCMRKCSGTG
jgi:hypothetical protein